MCRGNFIDYNRTGFLHIPRILKCFYIINSKQIFRLFIQWEKDIYLKIYEFLFYYIFNLKLKYLLRVLQKCVEQVLNIYILTK